MTASVKQAPSTITVHVPLKITTRGGRKTIVAPFERPATHTRFDDSMIKALARAYRWRLLIENGAYSSITELAKDKGINQSYACRLLRLTLLAPDIVEAILNCRGCDLTLDAIRKPLPTNWDAQRTALQI
jgi:hypothetical protein